MILSQASARSYLRTSQHQNPKEIKMQLNCSITHTLNQRATNEELQKLLSLMERDFFRPNQKEVIASFVSRQAIQNYLEGRH